MRTAWRIALLLVALVAVLVPMMARAAPSNVDVITIKGTINPVVADYVKRTLGEAAGRNASAVVIRIDTPGGLDTAMREIVQAILNSTVPVIVYVSPAGARAASAGTFITMAAHVAAMAPNTAIGAATPVQISEGSQVSDDLKRKIVNDATAYIRGIAESRGRNVAWAEKAVVEGDSINSQEALDKSVIDLVVPDLETLLNKIDGRKVKMIDGREITLSTKGATTNAADMSFMEQFLHTIADPNVAYLLLSLAILGIVVEVFSPGLIFPGVVGAIALFLALYALGVLTVNYAGVLLIVLAFALFITEALTPGFGLLFIGGLIAMIFGSLILFKGESGVRVSPWLIAFVSIVLVAVFGFVIQKVMAARRMQPSTGREELVGKTALVKKTLDPEGLVFLEGELWSAVSEQGMIEFGQEVVITRVDGLNLLVTPKKI